MYNIKKRFGTIYIKNNMTKEIEETILNDEKQMQKLYERIEELERINNEKDIEIKLLKEQNQIYLNIIRKNNLDIDNKKENINFNKGPALLDFNKMKQALNKDIEKENKENNKTYINNNDYINSSFKEKEINDLENKKKSFNENKDNNFIPTPSTSSDSKKINYENISKIKNKIIKIVIISYYKYKCEKIMKSRNEKNNEIKSTSVMTEPKKTKIRPERNKELPILDRFKVKVFREEDLKDSEILQFVGSEDCFLIEYQCKIAEKLNKKIENITIDDVIEFKIKYEGIRNISSRRTEIRHLITRSKYLFEKYGKKLCKFKISLYHLKIMSDDEWEEWLIEFDKLFNKINIDENICKHPYKSGNVCGKLNCKIKHKSTI